MRYWKRLIKEWWCFVCYELGLWRRRLSLQWKRLIKAFRDNLYREKDDLVDLGIDLALVIAAIFAGLLIGGFLGLIFVINALLVA